MPSVSSAFCGMTPIDTPIIPRVIFPPRSCGSSSRTVLIGMAKPMPDVACLPSVRVDRRIDADDFAPDVQERAAGVARVDGRVGLQHLRAPAFGGREWTLEGADDADADGMRQSERVPDRHDPVAGLHLARVAELDFRQRMIRLFGQLDERAVGQRVASDDARRVFLVGILAVKRDLRFWSPLRPRGCWSG
jgi:hypothetical protein